MASQLPYRDDYIHLDSQLNLKPWYFWPKDAAYERRFFSEEEAQRFADMWVRTRPKSKKVEVEKKKPAPRKRSTRYENVLAEPVD